MLGALLAVVCGTVTISACMLLSGVFAARIAKRHGFREVPTEPGSNIYKPWIVVDEHHCFWCAFWVNLQRGMRNE